MACLSSVLHGPILGYQRLTLVRNGFLHISYGLPFFSASWTNIGLSKTYFGKESIFTHLIWPAFLQCFGPILGYQRLTLVRNRFLHISYGLPFFSASWPILGYQRCNVYLRKNHFLHISYGLPFFSASWTNIGLSKM